MGLLILYSWSSICSNLQCNMLAADVHVCILILGKKNQDYHFPVSNLLFWHGHANILHDMQFSRKVWRIQAYIRTEISAPNSLVWGSLRLTLIILFEPPSAYIIGGVNAARSQVTEICDIYNALYIQFMLSIRNLRIKGHCCGKSKGD